MPAALLCLLVAAPAPFAKTERPDRRSDLEKIQGEWHCHDFRAVITGDRVRWYKGGAYAGLEEGIYLLPTARPKGIDVTVLDPSHKNVGIIRRGIYELYDDVLFIREPRPIIEGPRPVSLEGPGHLLVFRRKR
jgi:hypothetical protein